MRVHLNHFGQALCQRVPSFAQMSNLPESVTCKFCLRLLAELKALAKAEGK
jgi:hypothetical protein